MRPLKNSLSLSLTESVLFLRTPDFSARLHENVPPSMLRGLLILTLCKPTRISSIQVDLIGESVTTWTEAPSTRYQAQMDEKNKLFSASRIFFTAPRGTTTKRRARSLEPRLSDYADEDEPIHPRRPSHSSSTPDPGPVDMLRGRERGRARPSADDSIFPLELPPQEPHSRSPPTFNPYSPVLSEDGDLTASPMGSSRSPRRRNSSTAGETHRVTSFDNTSEAPGFPSRGRLSARFSLANVSSSILEAVRSVSGPSREHGPSQRGAESRGDDHSHPPSNHFGHPPEAGGLDNEQCSEVSGDGWHEFKKGTYTFPISFAIPSNVPPTMRCDYGSVTWRLKATVHRPGAFTSKLRAEREVVLVASPSEDNRESFDVVTMDRTWEDQLQYTLTLSGRMFPIGGTVPLTLTLLPMAKVKVFKILVRLEERVEYYYSFSPSAFRTEPERRFKLLTLESRDENTPLLPVPQTTSLMDSPLYSILNTDDNSTQFIAKLTGPGPWTFPMALRVPDVDGILHFSNKNKRAPIEISHTLKVVVRVQRAGEREIDPETGKLKFFDLTMRVPVHLLSVRPCNFRILFCRKFAVLTPASVSSRPFSLCQTPSTPLSRATRNALLHHHTRRPRTVGTHCAARMIRSYCRARLLRVYSRNLTNGHRARWTYYTNAT
ncbi:hypothetical protein BC827DRAFT_1239682 [Russula dissimulans]|nr:hypothetical protein BC827DRAFT_1239682 [Russula dissimulans]